MKNLRHLREAKIKILLKKYHNNFLLLQENQDVISYYEVLKELYADTQHLEIDIGGFLFLVNKIKKLSRNDVQHSYTINMNDLENILVNTVKLLLDDSNGISDEAYESLMELIFKIKPDSQALEYMAETESFKGRKFLNEDFELNS